jgi:hypothetical protein
MNKVSIVYHLEVRDGENTYKNLVFVTVEIPEGADEDDTITAAGENVVKAEYGLPLTTEPIDGDWYELEHGCRMVRHRTYHKIYDQDDVIETLERLL